MLTTFTSFTLFYNTYRHHTLLHNSHQLWYQVIVKVSKVESIGHLLSLSLHLHSSSHHSTMPQTIAFMHYVVSMLVPLLILLVVNVPNACSWQQEECSNSCNPSPPATYVPPPPPLPYSYLPPYQSYLAPPPPNWYYNAPPPPDPIWPFFPYYSRYPLHGSSDGFAPSPLVTILACSLLLLCT